MESTELTELEYELIEKFCALTNQKVPNRDEFQIRERNRNPVGFMTELVKNEAASKLTNTQRVFEDLPYASCGWEKNNVGFLLYFEAGKLVAIEGHTSGEEWPDDESKIIFD